VVLITNITVIAKWSKLQILLLLPNGLNYKYYCYCQMVLIANITGLNSKACWIWDYYQRL